MKNILFIIISIVLFFQSTAQSKKDEKRTEKKEHQQRLDSLKKKIEEANYADLSGIATYQEILARGSNMPYGEFYLGIRDFITNYLKLKIPEKSELERLKNGVDSCKVVLVYSGIGEFNEKLGAVGNYSFNFSLKFIDGSNFSFATKLPINGYTNYRTVVYNTCQFQFPITINRN